MIQRRQVAPPLLAFKGIRLRAWRLLVVVAIGAVVIVGAVMLSPWQPGGGSGAGSVHRASAWPRLMLPPGDGGVRVQLVVNPGGVLMPNSEAKSRRPLPMRNLPAVVVRLATGQERYLRTDRLGRFQVALPPGRYALGIASQYPSGPTWTLRVRANEVSFRRLHESVI